MQELREWTLSCSSLLASLLVIPITLYINFQFANIVATLIKKDGLSSIFNFVLNTKYGKSQAFDA